MRLCTCPTSSGKEACAAWRMPVAARDFHDVMKERNSGTIPDNQEHFQLLFVELFMNYADHHLSTPFNKVTKAEEHRTALVRVRLKWQGHPYEKSGLRIMQYDPPTPERALLDMAQEFWRWLQRDTPACNAAKLRTSALRSRAHHVSQDVVEGVSDGALHDNPSLPGGQTLSPSTTSALEEKIEKMQSTLDRFMEKMETALDRLCEEVSFLRSSNEKRMEGAENPLHAEQEIGEDPSPSSPSPSVRPPYLRPRFAFLRPHHLRPRFAHLRPPLVRPGFDLLRPPHLRRRSPFSTSPSVRPPSRRPLVTLHSPSFDLPTFALDNSEVMPQAENAQQASSSTAIGGAKVDNSEVMPQAENAQQASSSTAIEGAKVEVVEVSASAMDPVQFRSQRSKVTRRKAADCERDELHRLKEIVKKNGRTLVDCGGNGACQFDSLLHALTYAGVPDVPSSSKELRYKLVDFLSDKNIQERIWINENLEGDDAGSLTTFRETIESEAIRSLGGETTLEDYLRRMRKVREWGDGGTLLAAACVYKTRIVCYHDAESSGKTVIEVPPMWEDFQPEHTIHVACLHDNHFYSTKLLGPSLTGSSVLDSTMSFDELQNQVKSRLSEAIGPTVSSTACLGLMDVDIRDVVVSKEVALQVLLEITRACREEYKDNLNMLAMKTNILNAELAFVSPDGSCCFSAALCANSDLERLEHAHRGEQQTINLERHFPSDNMRILSLRRMMVEKYGHPDIILKMPNWIARNNGDNDWFGDFGGDHALAALSVEWKRWHVIVDPRSMKSGGSSSVYLVGHWRDYKRLHQHTTTTYP
ncbi:hypothetical protein AB1Y20_013731 [Prymnesium parvum]|uniref:OTU domain-containing protein n=1 Tax=Prymnesium parvum TaxID=97485 RepID=A0AB34IGD8_PRYPA